MKDAVGSTMLVYIVIIVVGIVGSILIASNMYTSAYKAKNNIVSSIDRYYMVNGNTNCFGDDGDCTNNITDTLKNMGYHYKTSCNNIPKKVLSNANLDDEGNSAGYPKVSSVYTNSGNNGYCLYKTELSESDYYYTVVTFSHLNINILGIGSLFSTPVYGETRTFYNG